MPELPEVEHARRLIDENCRGKVIEKVLQDDEIVFSGVLPLKFAETLKGKTVIAAKRRGKHLWMELSEKPFPLLHLGMTGKIIFKGMPKRKLRTEIKEAARYSVLSTENMSDSKKKSKDTYSLNDSEANNAKRRNRRLDMRKGVDDIYIEHDANNPSIKSEWPPKYWRCVFVFTDGNEMAFVDARRLGKIRLHDDPENSKFISCLGFDPLLDDIDHDHFKRLIKKRRGPLKVLLLDQKFCAGIGNWIADEVLYQTRLHPLRLVQNLTDEEIFALRENIYKIVRQAVACHGDYTKFPSDWLFHYRWDKGKKNAQHKTAQGESITYLKVGGRTCAFVKERQQLHPQDMEFQRKNRVKSQRKKTRKQSDSGVSETETSSSSTISHSFSLSSKDENFELRDTNKLTTVKKQKKRKAVPRKRSKPDNKLSDNFNDPKKYPLRNKTVSKGSEANRDREQNAEDVPGDDDDDFVPKKKRKSRASSTNK